MFLNQISISGFKNISKAKIQFSHKLNYITGVNGSGKTNLLDTVYYLSMTKSYFPIPDGQIINYAESNCHIAGEYNRDDQTKDIISFSYEKGGAKLFKRNSKPYQRLSDHIGVIPIVMVSPYDNCLINESGEERRKFINSILSQLDPEYLRRIQNYNQLLQQRNKLLKEDKASKTLLETFTERMSVNANYVYAKRDGFITQLQPIVVKYYNKLSGNGETISIEYRSDLSENSLENLLRKNEEKDRVFKYTTCGIQRDDIVFNMNGYKFRNCGSQGQQKTFLIALKLAQFEIMKEIYGKLPILLLDDVFDKLDMNRVGALLSMVSSDVFGQIFITDSNKVRVKEMLENIGGDYLQLDIKNGEVL
jgi:DNA replication and repair protein RecF